MAKVGTSNPDRTMSLKRLQCVVENNHKHVYVDSIIFMFRKNSFFMNIKIIKSSSITERDDVTEIMCVVWDPYFTKIS